MLFPASRSREGDWDGKAEGGKAIGVWVVSRCKPERTSYQLCGIMKSDMLDAEQTLAVLDAWRDVEGDLPASCLNCRGKEENGR